MRHLVQSATCLGARRGVVRAKTNLMPPRMPTGPKFWAHAQFSAMMGALRCLVAPPRLVASTAHLHLPDFVLNANDYRRSHQGSRVVRRPMLTMRLVHMVVIVLRLVVTMTAVQITGIPHVAVDVIAAMQNDERQEHSHENCPNDDDGRECPPGCPSCHCTHAMSALPVAAPSTVLDWLIPIEMTIAPYEAQGPPNPDPLTLYRPPRTLRASS